jgi:mono/diheme cytochrome c family protein
MANMNSHSDTSKLRALKRSGVAVTLMVMTAGTLIALSTLGVAQDLEVDPDLNLPESTEPVPEDGAAVAQKLCVGCHIIEGGEKAAVQADVPSFPAIADRPNQSFEALSNWLMKPHAPMPDPHLSRKEVRDLAGYILTLKSKP